jgi:hypothetical protein
MEVERISRVDRSVQFLRDYVDHSFICHEREELVEKLRSSDDPKLREIGVLEAEFLKMRKFPLRRK